MTLVAVNGVASVASAQEPAPDVPVSAAPATPAAPAQPPVEAASRYTLVEEFTADTLEPGEVKLGSDVDVGIFKGAMIGTDAVALAVGATTLSAKLRVWEEGEHRIALGLRLAYLSKDTLLWGNVNEHFEELDARVARPSIAWTHQLSPRLKLHTFWAKGFGKIKARLSEKGRRKLWETKHPGADYEDRDRATQQPSEPEDPGSETEDGEDGADTGGDGDANQEKVATTKSAYTSQSVQVQSIMGLAQERFQLTGEFPRAGGNKVLLTTRIEQTEFETLKSNFFRLTAAHQWIWTKFQIRLGIGAQYNVTSGRDLDGEEIEEAGVTPASDISFYWRF